MPRADLDLRRLWIGFIIILEWLVGIDWEFITEYPILKGRILLVY
jgi:hypothetical protein